MSRRLLGVLLGLVLTAALAMGPASPAAAVPTCDTYGLGTKLPVLLVHGFRSSGDTWNGSVYPRGGALPGTRNTFITETFDYSDQNTEWIQGNPRSTAAERLAERIQCLAQASSKNGGPGKVALVGHSLGGLLIRCALTPACSTGPEVAAFAGQVVTIGTPSLGSFLRPNAGMSAAVSTFGRVVEAECAAERVLSRIPSRAADVLKVKVWLTQGLCDLIDTLSNSTAGMAFTVGSQQLANLPKWPSGVSVRTLAGSIDFVYQVIAWNAATVNVGDAVVGVDSALSGAGVGSLGGTRTQGCGLLRLTSISLMPSSVPTALPTCNHVSETSDKRIAGLVGQAVGAWTKTLPPSGDACSDDAAFTAAALFAGPDLNDDGYFSGFEALGCADGYVVGVGYPVTETDLSYVVFQERPGGWTVPVLYPVGAMCGEFGLPEAVDALINCVPTTLPAYTPYTNARFGFTCEVPSDFQAGEESGNGDGKSFTSLDGTATVYCFGSNNSSNQTAEEGLADLRAAWLAEPIDITYEHLAGSTFTLSGTVWGDTVWFQRTVWGAGSNNTVFWSYPASSVETFRPAVEHSAASFRPGAVDVPN